MHFTVAPSLTQPRHHMFHESLQLGDMAKMGALLLGNMFQGSETQLWFHKVDGHLIILHSPSDHASLKAGLVEMEHPLLNGNSP